MSGMPVLEKLTKWRNVFASWQLGTRPRDDGEIRALKDHRELTILLRAEVTALTGLLVESGVISAEDFAAALEDEAIQLDHDYEVRFPGFTTSLDGVSMQMPQAHETMKRLGFPP